MNNETKLNKPRVSSLCSSAKLFNTGVSCNELLQPNFIAGTSGIVLGFLKLHTCKCVEKCV